ncbi:hypothetical protein MRX96_050248, partial [Rhipicephalus microplus]
MGASAAAHLPKCAHFCGVGQRLLTTAFREIGAVPASMFVAYYRSTCKRYSGACAFSSALQLLKAPSARLASRVAGAGADFLCLLRLCSGFLRLIVAEESTAKAVTFGTGFHLLLSMCIWSYAKTTATAIPDVPAAYLLSVDQEQVLANCQNERTRHRMLEMLASQKGVFTRGARRFRALLHVMPSPQAGQMPPLLHVPKPTWLKGGRMRELRKPYAFHVGFLLVVGTMLAVALSSFLVMHLFMVSKNETTLERLRDATFQELGDSFDLGNRYENFVEVFVSGVSTGGHIASSPAVETSPASSPSTLATAFAGLSAQPRLSPILKCSSQQKGRLSTVLECTETSDKGSGTTALWAHPEESLITIARQPSLIDGNFSCISPSVAFGHEEL